MSTKAAPLGLRLFLEGVEVPVISAQVTISPDQPAVASVQIIPTDMALAFLPRTLVHLFFLDDSPNQFFTQSKDLTELYALAAATGINRVMAPDVAYKLLFCGEILGYSYSKTIDQRQMVLQCMDLSTYWDCCYEFFSDYSVNGTGLTDRTATFAGATVGLLNNVAGGTTTVLKQILNTSPETPEYQKTKGLLGSLIHLLEVVGGVRYRSSDFPGYNGTNDFFSIAELRYNLLGMLGALEADDSSKVMFDHHAFLDWLNNGMTSLGSMLSFRDMLMYVNKFIFHNIYPNPCAHFVPSGSSTIQVTSATVPLRETLEGAVVIKNLETMIGSAGEAAALYRAASGGLYAASLTADQILENLTVLAKEIDAELDGIKTSDVPSYVSQFAKVKTDIEAAQQKSTIVVNIPEDEASLADASEACQTLVTDLSNIINPSRQSRASTRKPVTLLSGGHLYNQLILPEAFFVSPPRCNVIFPDQYFSFQYSRNFAREVTRVMCQAGLGMFGVTQNTQGLFTSYYVAPNIKDVRGKMLATSIGGSTRVILPHEVHSGIIPKFEWITDGMRWNFKGEETKGNTAQAEDQVPYIARLVSMTLYLDRWSSRSMSIQGIFMPYLVCGLPAVVLDRSAPSAAVIEVLKKALGTSMILPTQYVGKIVSLSHTLSQQGGNTAVGFAYSRAHRGIDDEFLSALVKETPVVPTKVNDSIDLGKMLSDPKAYADKREWYKQLIAAYADGKLQADTTLGGKLITSVTASGLFNVIPIEAETLGISFQIFENKKQLVSGSSIEISSVSETTSSLEVEAMQVPSTLKVSWSSLVGVGKFIESPVAFEEAVRPGWMQPNIWDNKHISKAVYAPLLGTVAITEDQSIGAPAQQDLLKIQATEGGITTPNISQYTVPLGSVEEAIDGLGIVYGMMKEKNADIHEFIRLYTTRPVANMVDVLGSQNLGFDPDGTVKDPDTMTEGFHSRAFGPYNKDVHFAKQVGDSNTAGDDALGDLMPGVFSPGTVKRNGVLDTMGPNPQTLDPVLDPRGRAQARVLAYIAELDVSHGLMG